MPPKRRIARQVPLQAAPAQSDYDTDTANLTDNNTNHNHTQRQYDAAMRATQPQRSAEELNLLVLRRWYPEISHILAIAPFATLYLFTPDTQQWTKCETEGVLFVVQLASVDGYTPRYRLVILNRKSMENFVLDLLTMDNIEITEEYVIVQVPDEDGAPQIFGIWIFSDKTFVPDTRQVIAATIVDCATKAEEYALHAAQLSGLSDGDAAAAAAPATAEDMNGEEDAHFSPDSGTSAPLLPQPVQNTFGQQIDLSTLFSRAPVPQAQQTQQGGSAAPSFANVPPALTHAHPSHFTVPADTEFFRQQQPQQQQPPQQQQYHQPPPIQSQQSNALLDLFKNASKLS